MCWHINSGHCCHGLKKKDLIMMSLPSLSVGEHFVHNDKLPPSSSAQ